MRIVCVWKEQSDYARTVRDFLRAFEHQTGSEIESLDPDTRAGATFAQAHDVVEYPTIMVVDDRSAVVEQWRGLPLPMVSQVSYYLSV